jgi:hypothetical protein
MWFRPSPSGGLLELLAPCSGVSELLDLGIITGRCLTTSSALSLAESVTAGSLVVSASCNGAQIFQPPDGDFRSFLFLESSHKVVPTRFWTFPSVFICLVSINIPMSNGDLRGRSQHWLIYALIPCIPWHSASWLRWTITCLPSFRILLPSAMWMSGLACGEKLMNLLQFCYIMFKILFLVNRQKEFGFCCLNWIVFRTELSNKISNIHLWELGGEWMIEHLNSVFVVLIFYCMWI